MRLVIISNRLPFAVSTKEGRVRFRESPGGLVSGLWSYMNRTSDSNGEKLDYLWIGWPGTTIPEELQEKVRTRGYEDYHAYPVFLSKEAMDRFYHGFCNETIWPLFHYFPTYTQYKEEYWEEYKNVNREYFQAVKGLLRPGDVVWVHDYQLMLLPQMIREEFPAMPIGFFLHIPFPSFEIFRLLPGEWRSEILEGLLGASLIGFHTHDYTRHFLSCVLRTLGYEHHLGRVMVRDRVVKADTFPMGIDFKKYSNASKSESTHKRIEKFQKKFQGMRVIFSVDRLDYTKGVINRLIGYNLFLERNPEWHGKVVFVLSVAPSRTGVETYQAMKREIDEWVGRIHGSYGSIHWSPILYQYRNMSLPYLVAMYKLCDVAMITPLRDGMNLVSKEFLASRSDQTGVLVLSEMAGSSKEMGEAIIVNPFHYTEIATALEQALNMPIEEQRRRIGIMQDRLARYDVTRWAEDFVHAINVVEKQRATLTRSLSDDALDNMLRAYSEAKRRAILLDYDGTLVPLTSDYLPELPDTEMLELLRTLSENSANEVVVVSSRSRFVLDRFLSDLPLHLIAENGAWLKPKDADWRRLKLVTTEWKEQIRPILQFYVDRLPGARLEERDYSLVWRYRRADPEQGSIRAKELMDDLVDYTKNIDVQVMEGKKVIEVRNAGVTKGAGALEWLGGTSYDFILACGDDWTDEDLFKALPKDAYSVRVGYAQTAARYYLSGPPVVRRLLGLLSESTLKAGKV